MTFRSLFRNKATGEIVEYLHTATWHETTDEVVACRKVQRMIIRGEAVYLPAGRARVIYPKVKFDHGFEAVKQEELV